MLVTLDPPFTLFLPSAQRESSIIVSKDFNSQSLGLGQGSYRGAQIMDLVSKYQELPDIGKTIQFLDDLRSTMPRNDTRCLCFYNRVFCHSLH